MTDIVERLRRERDEMLLMEASQLLYEAADEIERLRAALREIADDGLWPGCGEEFQKVARAALEQSGCNKDHEPNAETVAALEEAERGRRS